MPSTSQPDVSSYSPSSCTVWDYWTSAGTSSATTVNFTIDSSSSGCQGGYTRSTGIGDYTIGRDKPISHNRQSLVRAKSLLKLFLTPEQIESLDRFGNFIVQGETRRYRINKGRVSNIDELDDNGNVVAKICAHVRAQIPDFDNMLAQKLMIETDEQRFCKIGNRTPFRA